MAYNPYPPFLAVWLGVALHPLDRFGAVHGAGSGVPVLPCSQRKAALLEHAAGGHRLRGVLDWTFLSSRYLLPQLCPFQQDLRDHGRSYRVDGVALLDKLRHAVGRRAEL